MSMRPVPSSRDAGGIAPATPPFELVGDPTADVCEDDACFLPRDRDE